MGLFDQLKGALGDLASGPGEAASTVAPPEPLGPDHELAVAASALGFATDARLWASGYQYSTVVLGEVAAGIPEYRHDPSLPRESWRADAGLPAAMCGPSVWGQFHGHPVVGFAFTRGDQFHAQLGRSTTGDEWAHVTGVVVTLPHQFPHVALVPRRFGAEATVSVDVGALSQFFAVRSERPDFAARLFSEPVVASMSSTLDCLAHPTRWAYELSDRYLLIVRAGRADWAQLRTMLTHTQMLLDAIDPHLAAAAWEPATAPGPSLDTYPDVYPAGHGPLIGLTRRALTGVAAAVGTPDTSGLQALQLFGAVVRDQIAAAQADADPASARLPGWYETAPGHIAYFDGDFELPDTGRAIGDLWGVTPFVPPEGFRWPGYYFVDATEKRWWDGQRWTELHFTAGSTHRGRRPDGFVPPPPTRAALA